jgi:hypothetical protein
MSIYAFYGFLTMMTFDIMLIPQKVVIGVWGRILLIILWPIMLLLLLLQFFKNNNN